MQDVGYVNAFEYSISFKWGWIVLLLGTLATIAAGAMKGRAPRQPPPNAAQ